MSRVPSSRIRRRVPDRAPRRAFTLLEMIVVVTIIALLAGIIVPRLWNRVGTAKAAAAQTEVKAIAMQITAYMLDTGMARLDEDFDLEQLLLPPDEGGGSNGPYLNKQEDLVDPWDRPYELRVPGDENFDFDVYSAGEDGEYGSDDDVVN